MTSRRSNVAYSSSSLYSTTNHRNNYLAPQSAIGTRSPTPETVNAELASLRKDGKDYHVSVNLNSLISTNHVGSQPTLHQGNVINQHDTQQTIARSLERDIIRQRTSKGLDSFLDIKPSSLGSSKTILTVNGTSNSKLYEAYQTHPNQKNLLTVALPPKPPSISSYSLSPPISITARGTQGGGFAVKSVTSNNVDQTDRQTKRNERVEFDLCLKGHLSKEAQKSRTWEVVGTVPVQRNNKKNDSPKEKQTSRSSARAINEDEIDSRQIKDTAKELEELILSHPLIRDMPGDKIKIERQEDRLVDAPRGPSEGLVNVEDVIEEKVKLLMENGMAHIAVKVTCSRTVPMENSSHFKKSSVIVIKSMDFDMMESDARKQLYRTVIRKQNKAPGGQLDQQETNILYKALMQLIKREYSLEIAANGPSYGDDLDVHRNY